MRNPNVFMFSGQGSQYYQMGRALYDRGGVFTDAMGRLDKVVLELTGRPLIPIIYGEARMKDPFDRLLESHPAIFMVEVALAEHLISLGVVPHLTLGASLGTYAAAVVAGCIGERDALALVLHKAQCIVSLCGEGGMLAIFGDVAAAPSLPGAQHLTVAGRNFAGHYLVAGAHTHLEAVEAHLRGQGVATHRLPVKYAFHSPLVDAAREDFLRRAREVRYARARLPFICCADTRILSELPPDYLWHAARAPIAFQETLQFIEQIGAFSYIDVGPSGSLATFVKYGLPPTSGSSHAALITPFGNNLVNLEAVVQKYG